jgi:hypothetical protein
LSRSYRTRRFPGRFSFLISDLLTRSMFSGSLTSPVAVITIAGLMPTPRIVITLVPVVHRRCLSAGDQALPSIGSFLIPWVLGQRSMVISTRCAPLVSQSGCIQTYRVQPDIREDVPNVLRSGSCPGTSYLSLYFPHICILHSKFIFVDKYSARAAQGSSWIESPVGQVYATVTGRQIATKGQPTSRSFPRPSPCTSSMLGYDESAR